MNQSVTLTLEQIANQLSRHGYSVNPTSEIVSLKRARDDIEFLKALSSKWRGDVVDYLVASKSQLRQDLFVLSETGFKKNGFFVEFGATNGLTLSNSCLLEKQFSWDGILAEPARCWHADLRKNRDAIIDTRCVWTVSGQKLMFNETDIAELSTIDVLSSNDGHAERRKSGVRYEVETITLMELLEAHNSPSEIDYLSIDTEGSELEILKSFDFSRYKIRVITCEHNYSNDRDKINELLTLNGYKRKMESVSLWDDWYVKQKY